MTANALPYPPEKRLLVMDDEAAFGRFVRRTAEAEGYAVEVLTQSRAFAETFDRFRPTLVVLDMVMPEMDGIEIIRWLVAREASVRLAVITGFNPMYAHMGQVLAEAHGRMEVLSLEKPISVADLRKLLTAP
ncbi:MAG: response regulator [Alphaproteobacteria bacterium]